MSEKQEIITKIRRGEIDINNQSLFFPIVIKGLLLKLNEQLKIREGKVPHYIVHTGDDTMYLSVKGQNAAIEPLEISNEDFVYASVPRCLVTMEGLNIETDQLTCPYTRGIMQYESDNSVYTMSGEFRRVPIKLTVNCKYYVDSWGDLLELTQQIISKLAFIQTYHVSYLGQSITCSYTIPTSVDGEYTTELDGTTQDNKLRTTELSLELETNFPVWEPRTMVMTDDYVSKFAFVGNMFAGDTFNTVNGGSFNDNIGVAGNIISKYENEQDKLDREYVKLNDLGKLVIHPTEDIKNI